jgi:ribosomal protein S18 acetylase RimI-like enzyme
MTTTFKGAGSNIKVRIAKLPTDLTDIRGCRNSAYANKAINLPAAKSFVNADQIMKEGYICVIATTDANQQQRGVVVLGTADLNTKTGVVNNVYVRNEARQCGLGRAMMQTVEEYYAKNNTNNNANNNKKKKLKLTVMSNNIPAVTLYKSLGFTASGIYSILDSMTVMTRGALDFLIQMEKEI